MKRDNDAFALSRRYRLAPLAAVDRDAGSELVRSGGWSLELAWDGHRVLAVRAEDRVRIVSADFREWSEVFSGVALALRKLRARDAVLDGFLCATDDRGRPSFELLRARARTRAPALLAVWDLLHLDGEDLRTRPLHERRTILAAITQECGAAVTVSEPLLGNLEAILEATRTNGVPGVFARPEDGSYPSPDDPPWIVVPHGEGSMSWARSLSPPPVVTNETKVLYPRDGFTKKDVVAYYETIAEVMLPLLSDRPIVAQRWPDGIDEFTWYQHRIPPRAPDYVRGVWIEGNHRIVLPSKNALAWMVNQASLTLHGWSSRAGSLYEPDWVTLDLDPGERTTWDDVIEVATALRELLELLELPSVPKTSGQRGLHVLVPLEKGHSAAMAHEFARGVGNLLVRLLPDKVSIASDVEKRGGRLFFDHLQNFVGKSLVLAYSLRAVDGASVSAPLEWSEVTGSLDPKAFTLRTMLARVDAKGDLAAPLTRPSGRATLASALEKLRSQ